MAKNPRKPLAPTKKHLARLERERIQRRNIVLGGAIVIALVVLTIIYGILDQTVLRARQPVAVVNDDQITTSQFQAQVRYGRYNMVRNALNTYQFMQLFGNDPNTQASFVSQLQQIQFQLEPAQIGQTTLDQMIENKLIRQEAARRDITVSEEEINQAFQEAFGFYPDGTPTPSPTLEPIPTSTLSPLQMTLVPPTSTPTATPVITETAEVTGEPTAEITGTVTITPEIAESATEVFTPTPTGVLTPTVTPTPYTLEGYQELYAKTIEDFRTQYDITEADLRYVIEAQLFREKVVEAVVGEVSRTEEQVWARHILVEDEQAAQDILARIDAGEDFCSLAAELSTDTSNKDDCGDLSWFPKAQMDESFAEAAFALEVGEISDPVESQFGWHIIQALGHEDRPLTDSEVQQRREQEFQDWLTQQREAATIETRDYWTERVPTQPTLPPEIEQLILQSQQIQPTLPVEIPTIPPEFEETPAPEATP